MIQPDTRGTRFKTKQSPLIKATLPEQLRHYEYEFNEKYEV